MHDALAVTAASSPGRCPEARGQACSHPGRQVSPAPELIPHSWHMPTMQANPHPGYTVLLGAGLAELPDRPLYCLPAKLRASCSWQLVLPASVPLSRIRPHQRWCTARQSHSDQYKWPPWAGNVRVDPHCPARCTRGVTCMAGG